MSVMLICHVYCLLWHPQIFYLYQLFEKDSFYSNFVFLKIELDLIFTLSILLINFNPKSTISGLYIENLVGLIFFSIKFVVYTFII
jgi:hypothetical protein